MKPKDIHNWQISITDPAAIVEGIEDITQCIYTILTTIPGSDPLRPSFGSDVYRYLDKPHTGAKAQIIYAATVAIGRWEKRLEVTRCNVTRTETRTVITIEGAIVASAEAVTITTTI